MAAIYSTLRWRLVAASSSAVTGPVPPSRGILPSFRSSARRWIRPLACWSHRWGRLVHDHTEPARIPVPNDGLLAGRRLSDPSRDCGENRNRSGHPVGTLWGKSEAAGSMARSAEGGLRHPLRGARRVSVASQESARLHRLARGRKSDGGTSTRPKQRCMATQSARLGSDREVETTASGGKEE